MIDWKRFVKIEAGSYKDNLPIQLGNSIVVDGYVPKKKNAVFTHFHTDHMAQIDNALEYDKILLHPRTYDVAIALSQSRKWRNNIKPLHYGEPHTTKYGEEITLYDADHIVGSCQVHVKVDNIRILYSGDFVFPSADTPKCDILVLDATHGTPQFDIPTDKDSVLNRLLETIKEKLDDNDKPQSVIITASRGSLQELMNFLDQGNEMNCIFNDIPFIADSDEIKIKKALYGDSKCDRKFIDSSTPEAFRIKKYKSKCIIFITELKLIEPEVQSMYHVIVEKYAGFHKEANVSEHVREIVDEFGNRTEKEVLRINLLTHSSYDGIMDYVDKNKPQIVLLDSSRSKKSISLATDITTKFLIPGISIP